MFTKRSERNNQGGQTIIFGVLAMTVIFVIGAIVVDVGLWLSERRGAQKDADFSALAGAWELLNPAGTSADAEKAAKDTLYDNNQQGNASLEVVNKSCFNQSDAGAVIVDVRHASRSLFASIFNVAAPDVGAHAKACAGATNAPPNLIPLEIDNKGPCFTNGTPNFGTICGLDYSQVVGNSRGVIDLQTQTSNDHCSNGKPVGKNDIMNLIANGATGTCLINTRATCDPTNNGPWYDCVAVQAVDGDDVIDAIQKRFQREGACDRTYGNRDGTDDFQETVVRVFDTGPATSVYQARDCDPNTRGKQISPRLVSLIVLDNNAPPGSGGQPIFAFAGFYLIGCSNQQPNTQNQCQNNTGDCDDPNDCVVYGQFVNLIWEGRGVGQPSPSTTLFSVSLVD